MHSECEVSTNEKKRGINARFQRKEELMPDSKKKRNECQIPKKRGITARHLGCNKQIENPKKSNKLPFYATSYIPPKNIIPKSIKIN